MSGAIPPFPNMPSSRGAQQCLADRDIVSLSSRHFTCASMLKLMNIPFLTTRTSARICNDPIKN
jgi:hypothetical protein